MLSPINQYLEIFTNLPFAARAPASWLEEMHKGNPTWRGQPNYAVLVRVSTYHFI